MAALASQVLDCIDQLLILYNEYNHVSSDSKYARYFLLCVGNRCCYLLLYCFFIMDLCFLCFCCQFQACYCDIELPFRNY